MPIFPKANFLLHSLSTYGLDPGLTVIEAALKIYERKEGPMPDSISCIKTPIQ